MVPNRHSSSNQYRYGFNGKEKDDELKGEANHIDYGMRIYDPRIGKFLSLDPLTKTYPWYTPYQFAGNTPIAAIDLDGEEPKIVITGEVTGTTKMTVYGEGNVREITVRTYKAIIQYTNQKGNVTELGTFNVTRDGWYGLGTDIKGKTILYNRFSDPVNNDKLYIQEELVKHYTNETSAFKISPIDSPIASKYNTSYYDEGLPSGILPSDVKRDESGTVYGAEFHEGGIYTGKDGKDHLAGTYGCYGIVDPSQVSAKPGEYRKSSNDEMQRFEKAYDDANEMQIKENGETAKTEVEIKPRQRNVVKTVKTN